MRISPRPSKRSQATDSWSFTKGEQNVALTNSGERYITGYVEMTGDGPEDLKAMFRF